MDDQITIITQFNINRWLIKMLRIIHYMLEPLSYLFRGKRRVAYETINIRNKNQVI